MAPEAEDIMVQMIKRCGDSFQIVRHKRSTRLTLEKKPYSLKRDLKGRRSDRIFKEVRSGSGRPSGKSGGALQCDLRKPAACYPEEQVRRFLERETEVVVSTDAIGMGLNLPFAGSCLWKQENLTARPDAVFCRRKSVRSQDGRAALASMTRLCDGH